MSDISTRIVPDPVLDVTLNAYVFGSAAVAFILRDRSAAELRTMVNNHITDNGGAILTAAEESDISDMRTFYDGLSNFDKHAYRDKVILYSQLLQDGHITEAVWDELLLGILP